MWLFRVYCGPVLIHGIFNNNFHIPSFDPMLHITAIDWRNQNSTHYSRHEFKIFCRGSSIDFVGKLKHCNAEESMLHNDHVFWEPLDPRSVSTINSVIKGIIYKGRTTRYYCSATQRYITSDRRDYSTFKINGLKQFMYFSRFCLKKSWDKEQTF
jgi:hypothetical protein